MRRLGVWGVAVVAAGTLRAASDPRTGGHLLTEFADARVTALGNAAAALSGDLSAAAFNPAALPTLNGRQVSTQFEMAPGDVRTGLLSYGRGGGWAGWSLSLAYLDAGRIEIVPLSGPAVSRRAQEDVAASLAVGVKTGERLRWGAGVKGLYSTLVERYHASAVAADAGFQADLTRRLTFGLSALNMGGELVYRDVGDPLPTQYRAGLSYLYSPEGRAAPQDTFSPWYTRMEAQDNYLTFTGEAVLDRFGAVTGGLGLEWDYAHRAVFRVGGVVGAKSEGLTAGVGFFITSWRLDYSFQAVNEIDDRHRLTVSWFWNRRS